MLKRPEQTVPVSPYQVLKLKDSARYAVKILNKDNSPPWKFYCQFVLTGHDIYNALQTACLSAPAFPSYPPLNTAVAIYFQLNWERGLIVQVGVDHVVVKLVDYGGYVYCYSLNELRSLDIKLVTAAPQLAYACSFDVLSNISLGFQHFNEILQICNPNKLEVYIKQRLNVESFLVNLISLQPHIDFIDEITNRLNRLTVMPPQMMIPQPRPMPIPVQQMPPPPPYSMNAPGNIGYIYRDRIETADVIEQRTLGVFKCPSGSNPNTVVGPPWANMMQQVPQQQQPTSPLSPNVPEFYPKFPTEAGVPESSACYSPIVCPEEDDKTQVTRDIRRPNQELYNPPHHRMEEKRNRTDPSISPENNIAPPKKQKYEEEEKDIAAVPRSFYHAKIKDDEMYQHDNRHISPIKYEDQDRKARDFLLDKGEFDRKSSLDKQDSRGNYSPDKATRSTFGQRGGRRSFGSDGTRGSFDHNSRVRDEYSPDQRDIKEEGTIENKPDVYDKFRDFRAGNNLSRRDDDRTESFRNNSFNTGRNQSYGNRGTASGSKERDNFQNTRSFGQRDDDKTDGFGNSSFSRDRNDSFGNKDNANDSQEQNSFGNNFPRRGGRNSFGAEGRRGSFSRDNASDTQEQNSFGNNQDRSYFSRRGGRNNFGTEGRRGSFSRDNASDTQEQNSFVNSQDGNNFLRRGGRNNFGTEGRRGSFSRDGRGGGYKNFRNQENRPFNNRNDNYEPQAKTEETEMDWDEKPAEIIDKVTITPLKLTMGKVMTVYPVYYYTPTKFFIQLSEDVNSINEKIIETCESLELVSSVDIGEYYLAQYNEDLSWYRAQVLNINGNNIKVKFIDYGNEAEVELNKIKKLSKEIAEFSNQAIECCLRTNKTVWTKEESDEFETCFKNYEVAQMQLVSEIEENIFSVIIYDQDSKPINEKFGATLDNLEPKTTVLRTEIIDNSLVEILYFFNPEDFYINSQTSDPTTIIEKIEKLRVHHSLETVKLNMFVLASMISGDKTNLSRTQIIGLKEDKVRVVSIDFGWRAVRKLSDVYALPEYLLELPQVSVHCGINDIKPIIGDKWPKDSEEINDIFKKSPYTIKIFNKINEKLSIDLIKDDKSVQESLINNGLATTLTEPIIIDEVSTTDDLFTSGSSCHVIVTQFTNLNLFYVQLSSKQTELEQLQSKLNSLNLDSSDIKNIIPTENSIVAAKFNDDGVWYRAKILRINENDSLVEFIDYGNSDTVTEIKLLPSEFENISPYAYKCTLPILSNECTEDIINFYANIIMDESAETVAKIYKEHDGHWIIDMIINNQSSIDIITKEYPSITKCLKQGYISRIESPNDLCIQFKEDTEKLHELENKLKSEVINYETITENDIKVGEIYLVYNKEQDNWYRAKILYTNPIQVQFIDTGDIGEVDIFKQLPDDIKNLPYVAKYCKLIKLPNNIEEFISNVISDSSTLFTIIIHNQDENCLFVSLLKDDKIFYEESTTQEPIKNDDDEAEITTSSIPTKTQFRVTCFESTKSFYIQLLENENKYNELQNKIHECIDTCSDAWIETFISDKDIMFLSLYNNMWYRSKIINENQVFLIDVGKTISMKDRNHKHIPDDLKDTEGLTIKCCLFDHSFHQDDEKLILAKILRERNAIFEAFININNIEEPLVIKVYKNDILIEDLATEYDDKTDYESNEEMFETLNNIINSNNNSFNNDELLSEQPIEVTPAISDDEDDQKSINDVLVHEQHLEADADDQPNYDQEINEELVHEQQLEADGYDQEINVELVHEQQLEAVADDQPMEPITDEEINEELAHEQQLEAVADDQSNYDQEINEELIHEQQLEADADDQPMEPITDEEINEELVHEQQLEADADDQPMEHVTDEEINEELVHGQLVDDICENLIVDEEQSLDEVDMMDINNEAMASSDDSELCYVINMNLNDNISDDEVRFVHKTANEFIDENNKKALDYLNKVDQDNEMFSLHKITTEDDLSNLPTDVKSEEVVIDKTIIKDDVEEVSSVKKDDVKELTYSSDEDYIISDDENCDDKQPLIPTQDEDDDDELLGIRNYLKNTPLDVVDLGDDVVDAAGDKLEEDSSGHSPYKAGGPLAFLADTCEQQDESTTTTEKKEKPTKISKLKKLFEFKK